LRIASALLLALAFAQPVQAEPAACKQAVGFYQPKGGMIGNARSATAIALVYLTDIYGQATMRRELPLKAELDQGVWIVTGSSSANPHEEGGVAEIRLCRRNGAVLRVVHGE
jgi:hypothetical protein